MTSELRPRTRRAASPGMLLVACLIGTLPATIGMAQQAAGISQSATLEDSIRQRLAQHPDDAPAWRMLGRIRAKRGDQAGAHQAFLRALQLDPHSAAVHFDLGSLLWGAQQHDEARQHLRQVIDLAPDSEYAGRAENYLAEISMFLGEANVEQVGYEVKNFTGADEVDDEQLEARLFGAVTDSAYIRVETGLLYNSNVALTPISRELSPKAKASAQLFLAPQFEFSAWETENWRAGPAFSGYFNLNEGGLREFNVQNYQPGIFVEQTLFGESATMVPRLQYDFTHDEFDAQTFGNRHALTASTLFGWNDEQRSFIYWTIDYTDFLNDGLVPSISSRDGVTNTFSLSHKIPMRHRHLRSLRAGVDLQRADVRGSDFAFNGIGLFGEADVPLTAKSWLVLQLGWGYRDYFDFEFSPSRNEHIWQAGVELRRRINESVTIAGVVNYDRFDSENVLFEAERFISGIVLTIER